MKPIIGCEVYVADDRAKQHKGHAHLTLLADSNAGYANLIKLCSLGYLEGYYYRPRVDWELLERYAPGLIALSGCLSGPGLEGDRRVAPERRRAGARPARADLRPRQHLRRAAERRPRHPATGLPGARRARRPSAGCRSSRPVTSTTSTRPTRTRTRRCSASSRATRSRTRTTGSSARTSSTSSPREEMALDFPGHEDAMRRTLEVAERCNVEIELGRILLPAVPDARTAATRSTTSSSSASMACEALRHGDAGAHRASPVRAEDDPRDGLCRLLPDRRGLHRLRQARTASSSAPAAARPRARSSPTASRSRTSTRSATTCCSSGSSTRAASRCPTSTSTSPSRAASA